MIDALKRSLIALRSDSRLLRRHARLEPGDAEERVALARGFGRQRERPDQIDLVAGREDRVEVERRRQDADDPDRVVVQRQRLADDVGAAAEAALPEGMAQDRDRRRVEAALVGGEVAAERQGDAKQLEEIVGDAD